MVLEGKTVLFLGSSVTLGAPEGSFVELMTEQCGLHSIKEAVNGTTLADTGENSYVSRLKKLDPDTKVDLLICQLSTNDVSQQIDPERTEAAICFILEYAETVFRCPIVFYTGTYMDRPAYAALIQRLYALQHTYRFHILDLFHDPEMLAVTPEDYKRYMRDPVHPTFAGYREWWTPKFIAFCEKLPS